MEPRVPYSTIALAWHALWCTGGTLTNACQWRRTLPYLPSSRCGPLLACWHLPPAAYAPGCATTYPQPPLPANANYRYNITLILQRDWRCSLHHLPTRLARGAYGLPCACSYLRLPAFTRSPRVLLRTTTTWPSLYLPSTATYLPGLLQWDRRRTDDILATLTFPVTDAGSRDITNSTFLLRDGCCGRTQPPTWHRDTGGAPASYIHRPAANILAYATAAERFRRFFGFPWDGERHPARLAGLLRTFSLPVRSTTTWADINRASSAALQHSPTCSLYVGLRRGLPRTRYHSALPPFPCHSRLGVLR